MKTTRPNRLPSLLSGLLLTLSCCFATAQSVDELLKQGDVYDRKFQPAEALKYYLPAEKTEPENLKVLLCIARQYRHLMQDASDKEEKLKYGAMAKDYAERAVKIAPKDAEAHLSVAITHAKMTPYLGTKERLEASKEVKAAVDKTIELNPKIDQAWHILGCWHQRLADISSVKRAIAAMVYGGLPAASNDDSVKCLQKAIDLNPECPKHFIELGRTFAQMGKNTEAKEYIEKGLSMPNIGKDDAEVKQTGRETLEKLN